MRRILVNLGVLVVVLAWCDYARADYIVGLFNTGVDDSGNLLPALTPDPHYSLISYPIGSYGGTFATVPTAGTTTTSWVANSSTSQWITSSYNTSDSAGLYVYRLTFNLSGLDPSTATITGEWATDNQAQVFVNGVNTGVATGNEDFDHLTAFTISAANAPLTAGLNTLDFYVTNSQDGLTGLRVDDLSGTAVAVPAPPSLTLLLIGIAGLAGHVWRRRFGGAARRPGVACPRPAP